MSLCGSCLHFSASFTKILASHTSGNQVFRGAYTPICYILYRSPNLTLSFASLEAFILVHATYDSVAQELECL